MDFNSEIQKLLSLKTSGLENQFKISILLQEIQNIISDNGENLENPVAYFAILMSLLSKDQDENSEPLLYIMDKVLPLIPENILILKFNSISDLLISFLNLTSMGDRSIIGSLESLLLKMENKDLHFKEKLRVIMGLVTDSRPKVRKRAVEAISKLFEKDSSLILNYSIQILKQAESVEKLHVILQFLKSISHNISTKGKIMDLVEEIIKLPKKYVGSMITGKMVFDILQEIIHGILILNFNQRVK